MIEIRLGAQHLGKKVIAEDGTQGSIKAYNNVTRTLFVFVGGKMMKYTYEQLSLDDGSN